MNIYTRKTYKEEGDNQQEKITYKKSSYNSNKISGGKYENKYCFGKKYIKEDESKNKKVEKDLKDELENSINNNYIYPTKTFKNENPIQEEKIPYKKSSYNSSKLSGGKYENKFYLKQKIINKDEDEKEKDKDNKKLEKKKKEWKKGD